MFRLEDYCMFQESSDAAQDMDTANNEFKGHHGDRPGDSGAFCSFSGTQACGRRANTGSRDMSTCSSRIRICLVGKSIGGAQWAIDGSLRSQRGLCGD
jgi:hypothetical protein